MIYGTVSWVNIFGRKRKPSKLTVAQDSATRWMSRAMEAEREVRMLRSYLNEQMKTHFTAYNGGLQEQLRHMITLALPTPFVPVELKEVDYPTITGIQQITYVREQRWVPLKEAGRI